MRPWMSVEIRLDDFTGSNLHAVKLNHPACCDKSWAVACLILALRHHLKSWELRRREFLAIDQSLRTRLLAFFPEPDIDGYWQLAQERSLERSRKRTERKASEDRRRAVSGFVATGKCESENNLPECFRKLGFHHLPTSRSEIKEAYFRLALVTHPDRGAVNGKSFKSIEEAYRFAMAFWDQC